MPVKIRLQRHGKKGSPFYHVVAADSRAKRDGRFIEKLGIYNPNTNPATVVLNIDKSVDWLEKGAQPTDTARNILSEKGVMLKKHLNMGVKKGAMTAEQARAKFEAWSTEKESKINKQVNEIQKVKDDAKAKSLAAEKKINEDRIAKQLSEKVVPENQSADVKTETTEAKEDTDPSKTQVQD